MKALSDQRSDRESGSTSRTSAHRGAGRPNQQVFIRVQKFTFHNTTLNKMWTFLRNKNSETPCPQCGYSESKLVVLTAKNKCTKCNVPKIRLDPKSNSIILIEDVYLGPNEKVLLDSNLSIKLPKGFRATLQPFVSDKWGSFISDHVRPLATYYSTEFRGPLVLHLKNSDFNKGVRLFEGCVLAKLYLSPTYHYDVKHYNSNMALPPSEANLNGNGSLGFLKQTFHEYRCQCRPNQPHTFVGMDELDCGSGDKQEDKNNLEV